MRSAAQITRTPAEYHDFQQQQRLQTLAALRRDLERANALESEWYVWLCDRAAGRHRHDLVDAEGRTVACPVSGCDALRGCANPHRVDREREAAPPPPPLPDRAAAPVVALRIF